MKINPGRLREKETNEKLQKENRNRTYSLLMECRKLAGSKEIREEEEGGGERNRKFGLNR